MPLAQLLATILFWIALVEGVIALTLYLSITFYRFFRDIRREQKRSSSNSPEDL